MAGKSLLRHQLGDIRIDRIVESENDDIVPTYFFPDTTQEDWEAHQHWLQPMAMNPDSGNLILPIQSYLLRTPHHTILVDACVGDHKSRERPHWHQKSGGLWLKRLSEAGVRPEEIDYVLCTHLHADHVGWNTQLINGRWVPTFPNARYIFSSREWNHWQSQQAANPQEHFIDSVLPIVEAGRADLVEMDFTLDDTVSLLPTPGHSPHHMSIRLTSGGEQAVLTGDVTHSPVQCREPDWCVRPDGDPAQARKTRRAFFDTYCETGTLICTTHYASPSMGRIERLGEAYDFDYLDDATLS